MATKSSAKSSKKSSGRRKQPVTNSRLQEFFVDSLQDIYWAEKHLTKALPEMQKAVTTPKLQDAFESHLGQTMDHVTRLEQVFEIIGEKPLAKKCEAMEGLTKEADSIVDETDEGTMTRDAAVIMAAQKVEHYEIASYGTVRTWAERLGYNQAAQLLQQTLDEEGDANKKLTQLAESHINMEAQ